MLIAFASDYGLRDEFVGVCKAVMLGLAPDVRVLDISHEIPAHDVRAGALLLVRAVQYALVRHNKYKEPLSEAGSAKLVVALVIPPSDLRWVFIPLAFSQTLRKKPRIYSFQAMRTPLPKSARNAAGHPPHALSLTPCAGLPARC